MFGVGQADRRVPPPWYKQQLGPESQTWKWNGESLQGSFVKRLKARHERRRARLEPDCQPLYNRYGGYE